MKKILPILLFLMAFSHASQAQISHDMLLGTDTAPIVKADKTSIVEAEESARRLLNRQPQTLRKQNFPQLRSRQIATTPKVTGRAQSAPFGLVWGSSIVETQNQGVILSPIEEKDYANSFRAQKLPKAVKDFTAIDVTFGDENELWRIIAYGKLLDDDAKASKALQMYNTYSGLLAQKYGNKQEFFIPAQIDVTQKDAYGKDITVQQTAPLGNPNFLSQLQSGAATLYSTYHNQEVGATLAVNVDGDGKSYIVVDYKNLQILQAREKQTLDAL